MVEILKFKMKNNLKFILNDALEDVKKAELPEDVEKSMENEIQEMVNDANKKIEAKFKEKEQELLTV